MQDKISPRTRGRYLAFGLLGMVALAGPAVGDVVTAAGKSSFPITYGGDRFLGVFLGFDGDKQSPIVLGTPETIDVNGDGLEDVVFSATARSLAQESPLRARIFVSNGKTLKDKTKKLLSGTTQTMVARDLHVGDLNGDGKPDVFFSNHGPESISPFPGEQNRLLLSSAQSALTDASGTHLPQQVDFSHGSDIGDLDGDGDLDIFVPNLGSALNFPSNLLHNDGTGNFTVVATRDAPNGILPAGAPTRPDAFWSQICDMDGDGDLDIYISSSLSGPWPATIQYLVNGAGAFTYSAASIPNFPEAKGLPQDSACADIDRDGDDDVLLFNNTEGGGDYIQILINQGDGTLTDGSARIPSQKPGKSMPATSGAPFFSVIDLEGDGDPDFLVQRWNADVSRICRFRH